MKRVQFLLPLIIPIVFFVVGLATLPDYGETSDEKFDIAIGEFYYRDWSRVGFDGLLDRFQELQRNYGPVFNTIVVAVHDTLHHQFALLNGPAAYHLPTLAISCALIYLTYHIGAVSGGSIHGLLAALLLSLLPRFVGDSQANLKDTPLAFFFGLTLYFAFRARESRSTLWTCAAGVALGLTYGIKINALVIPIILALWVLSVPRLVEFLSVKCWLLALTLLVISYLTVLVVWPYYRSDPFIRFSETYRVFREAVWNEEILYFGNLVRAKDVPWHYPFAMILVTTPLVVLGGLGGQLFIRKTLPSTPSQISMNRLCWIWLLLPLAVHGFSGAPMYDGVRHYSMVFSALSVVSAGGIIKIWHSIGERIRSSHSRKGVLFIVATSSCANLLLINVKLHPYQIAFFNEFVGGTKGASLQFDLDYWGLSLKTAATWLNHNAAPGSSVYVPFGIHHLPLDRSRIRASTRFTGLTDYKVVLLRGMLRKLDPTDNYLIPSRQPVFTVTANGAPLLRVFAFPEHGVNSSAPIPVSPGVPTRPRVSGAYVTSYRDALFEDRDSSLMIDSLMPYECGERPAIQQPINLEFEALLNIPTTGKYCFSGVSDDDSALGLGDAWLLKVASETRQQRTVLLAEGNYQLRIRYINDIGPGCFRFALHAGECSSNDPSDHGAQLRPFVIK